MSFIHGILYVLFDKVTALIIDFLPKTQRLLIGVHRRSVGHVDETAVMALESDGDIGGRTIPVLDQHDVRFSRAR